MLRLIQPRFIGIDLSIRGTAIVLLSGKEVLDIRYFTTKVGQGKKDPKAYYVGSYPRQTELEKIKYNLLVSSAITNFIQKHLKGETTIGIEGYSMGSKGRVFDIAELTAITKYKIYHELGKRYYTVPPTSLKKFVTNNGRASKEKMVLGVYKKWNIDFSDKDDAGTDLCDAFAIAKFFQLFGKFKKGDYNEIKQYQIEVFTKMEEEYT